MSSRGTSPGPPDARHTGSPYVIPWLDHGIQYFGRRPEHGNLDFVDRPPVIDLSKAPGKHESWDRPAWMVYLWSVVELLVVSSSWQISSSLRVKALRAFGADIGEGVVMRPRIRVRFPWKLRIGARSWIGEGVWIHNQDRVEIGADVVVSQESFITTGSHAYAEDMALVTKPVTIEDGAWVTARCIVLGGSRVGISALVTPGTVVRGEVPGGMIFGSTEGTVIGERFAKRKDRAQK